MSEKLNNNSCICHINFELSPQIKDLVSKGELKCSSDEKYCDQKIPFTIQNIKGQDISCVGENNSNCPKYSQKQK